MNGDVIFETKFVGNIEGSFIVPSYQRGFRWGEIEILRLLDDIYSTEGKRNYYLQPIVVRKKGDGYELIDGQQRLTTIYLIYQYMNKESFGFIDEPKFTLSYETREKSKEFLKSIDESRRNENIDFGFIYSAYESIKKWFSKKDKKSTLTNINTYFDEKVLPLAGYYKVNGYDCSANGETYVAVASCTAQKDCAGNAGIAYNKVKRSQCVGKVGNDPVECGGETFVSSCRCPYKKGDAINENGGLCLYYEQNTNLLSSGYYKVDGYECTAGNETGAAIAGCTTNKDCLGQPGPAYGMKNCKASGLYPADTHPVVCGGNVYSKLCKDACNYDDTEATCRQKGKKL